MHDATFVADSKPMDGPHCCDGYVKFRLHAVRVPVSREAVSCTRRVHVPIAFVPLTAARGESGRTEPVKGDAPALIGVAAESSKTVLVKLSPLPPRWLLSMIAGPTGGISEMIMSLS